MQSPGHIVGRPSRRALLAVGASLTLAGCSDGPAAPAARATYAPNPDPAIRRRAATATAALIAAYDAALTAHPGLAARLRPLRAQLVQHRAAFTTETATSIPTPPGRSPVTTAAATPAATLAGLATAERRTADSRTADLAAASPDLARLLASVAAAGAVHALRLTRHT